MTKPHGLSMLTDGRNKNGCFVRDCRTCLVSLVNQGPHDLQCCVYIVFYNGKWTSGSPHPIIYCTCRGAPTGPQEAPSEALTGPQHHKCRHHSFGGRCQYSMLRRIVSGVLRRIVRGMLCQLAGCLRNVLRSPTCLC